VRELDDRGSASVELVLVTPVLLVVLLFVVALGRLADARAQVDSAARDAARAASIARGPDSARTGALAAAGDRLAEGGVTCRSLDVQVDVDGFRAGGTVMATVTCDVDFGDLTLLGVPGNRAVAATAAEVVDVYRGATG
jgi:Flp pilus assembly protein TadG